VKAGTKRQLPYAVALGLAATSLAAGAAGPPRPEGIGNPPGTHLFIEIWRRPGLAVHQFTLVCDPPAGTLPSPEDACAGLAVMAGIFAPAPPDVLCTQVYGGPAVAAVRGTYRGRPIEATFNRRNGCEIERYDRLMRALGLTT
jgi:hypothetical protein